MLDLFAGSGQLGLEALSRGAAEAVFVDASRESADVVRRNIAAVQAEGRAKVFQTDYEAFLPASAGALRHYFPGPPLPERASGKGPSLGSDCRRPRGDDCGGTSHGRGSPGNRRGIPPGTFLPVWKIYLTLYRREEE